MIFCGVFCCKWHVDITVLSDDFDYLDSKKFTHTEYESIGPWIDSLTTLKKERCVYFLNDNAMGKCLQYFTRSLHPDKSVEIYYIPDRRIAGFFNFLYHYHLAVRMIDHFYFSQSYILASSFRLFDLPEMSNYFYNRTKAKIDPGLF